MARLHVVVVPYPGSGNINPAPQVAKLLHRHGAYVTFVNTEHNHRLLRATEGAGAVRGREGFRFETIPDRLSEADRGKQDYSTGLAASITATCAAPFRALVARLDGGGEPGVPRVTCVLATMLMSFALDVSREMGVPTVAFWTGSAASLMADMRLRDLRERGYLPLNDESYLTNGYLETTVIDCIPGMPPMSLGSFSSFLRTADPEEVLGTQLWAASRRTAGGTRRARSWPPACRWRADRCSRTSTPTQVAERVREVMASEEMRRNAARWKAEAEAAAGPSGSSYENLLAMVRSLSSSSDSSQAFS